MFKPHNAICVGCRQETLVVVKAMLCARCNYKRKQDKKRSEGKKVSVGISKRREPTGEMNVFEAVLNNLPDHETRCFVCRKRVAVVTHNNMAHVLSKGRYPKFRLEPRNIVILCHRIIADKDGNGCHNLYDHSPHSELKGEGWERLFAHRDQLLEEYKKLYK